MEKESMQSTCSSRPTRLPAKNTKCDQCDECDGKNKNVANRISAQRPPKAAVLGGPIVGKTMHCVNFPFCSLLTLFVFALRVSFAPNFVHDESFVRIRLLRHRRVHSHVTEHL
jgi:hypothetical protein